MPRDRIRRRLLLGWGAVVAAIGVPFLFASSASSDTTPPSGLTTQASSPSQSNVSPNGPFINLVDGTSVTVNITATGASAGKLFAADARLCKPGLNMTQQAQFNPTLAGLCVNAPLSANSDDFVSATVDTVPNLVSLAFRVGTGTQTYSFTGGGSSTITCDATHPCSLWLRVQVDTSLVSTGNVFTHYDLCFAATCATTTTTTTSSTTTTTLPLGTTTTGPSTTTTTGPSTTTTTGPSTTTTTGPSTTSTTRPSTTTTSATVDPSSTSATTSPPGGVLGVTGIDARHIIWSGLGLAVAGALLLGVGVRRRQGDG